MTAGVVTRSQIAKAAIPNSVFIKKGIALTPIFFNAPMNLTTKNGPALNEIVAAANFPGLHNNPENLIANPGGGILYEFTPSNLRTIYKIIGFSVPIPSNLIGLKFKSPSATKELEVQYGWVAKLNVTGTFFVEEFPIESLTKEEERFAKSTLASVQLPQTMSATPGSTLNLELIPFVRILRAKEITEVFSFTSWVVFEAFEVREATLIYEQEFHEHPSH